MGSQYESEKVGIILAQEEPNGLHLVQFECPRHLKPTVSSNFEVGRIPISKNWPSGVIRMGSQYESEKIEKFSGQKRLILLQIFQFEWLWD